MMEYIERGSGGWPHPRITELAPLVVMVAPLRAPRREELYERLGFGRWPIRQRPLAAPDDPAKVVEETLDIAGAT